MSRMTWKAEVSDIAVQSTTVLQEPIQTTEKWRWKFFFHALRGEIIAMHLYTLPLAVAVPLQNTSLRRWIGRYKSMSGLCPCCCHKGGRLSTLKSFFNKCMKPRAILHIFPICRVGLYTELFYAIIHTLFLCFLLICYPYTLQCFLV